MQQIGGLGYDLHGRPYDHAPGCSQLDIMLRDMPTRLHYDPERLHLTVIAPPDEIRPLTIGHQWYHTPLTLWVAAGRVRVEDRVEKRVEFLTLGGKLAVLPQPGFTLCSLHSPAPIIALRMERCMTELLADEIEEILARRRAWWDLHDGEFERRLAAAKPAALYMACLIALQEKFRDARLGSFDDETSHLIRFVDDEIGTLCGSAGHRSAAPALEDII
jgi:hypothetical protein